MKLLDRCAMVLTQSDKKVLAAFACTAFQVDKMVTAMKAAFKKNLPHLSWMSPESLKAAEAKLEKIADYIGFPAFILNSTWLDALYTDVQVSTWPYLRVRYLGSTCMHI